jgi:GR25 family glycosyltransferase involved in LPS biosynthesis
MKLYCLTCDQYRKEKIMEPQIPKLTKQSNHEPLTFKFIKGLTGNNIKTSLPYIYAKSTERRALRDNEIAISLNHYRITQEFYETGEPLCMICEDDVVFISPESLLERFRKYVQESKILALTTSMPHLLYGCYIERPLNQAMTRQSTENKFHRSGARYGNPFYIINRAFAHLILANFYPIVLPYDDYLRQLLITHTVRGYRAVPMFAYELSSDFYRSFHSPADIEHRKHIQRESKKVSGVITTPIIGNEQLSLEKSIIIKERKVLFNDIETISEIQDSIICGAGITDPANFKLANKRAKSPFKPFLVLSVRGPLTRRSLMNMKIWCPEKYGDTLLLISDFYTPLLKSLDNPLPIVGIVCSTKDAALLAQKAGDLIKNENVRIITKCKSLRSSNTVCDFKMNTDLQRMCGEIWKCTHILSSSLKGLIIAHSFGKFATWITTSKLTYAQKYRFIDYYKALIKMNVKGIKSLPKPINVLEKAANLYLPFNDDKKAKKLKNYWTRILPKDLLRIKDIIRGNNPIIQQL